MKTYKIVLKNETKVKAKSKDDAINKYINNNLPKIAESDLSGNITAIDCKKLISDKIKKFLPLELQEQNDQSVLLIVDHVLDHYFSEHQGIKTYLKLLKSENIQNFDYLMGNYENLDVSQLIEFIDCDLIMLNRFTNNISIS